MQNLFLLSTYKLYLLYFTHLTIPLIITNKGGLINKHYTIKINNNDHFLNNHIKLKGQIFSWVL